MLENLVENNKIDILMTKIISNLTLTKYKN